MLCWLKLVVSRGQTANFFTGRYRLQYMRALILQAITPCKKISSLATRDYKTCARRLIKNNKKTGKQTTGHQHEGNSTYVQPADQYTQIAIVDSTEAIY